MSKNSTTITNKSIAPNINEPNKYPSFKFMSGYIDIPAIKHSSPFFKPLLLIKYIISPRIIGKIINPIYPNLANPSDKKPVFAYVS